MRNSSRFAESLAELISEQVTSELDDWDISDKVQEEIGDIDEKIGEKVDDLNLDKEIESKVDDAMENYDFGDAVQKELESCLTDAVEEEMKDFWASEEFAAKVAEQVEKILAAKEAAIKAKLLDWAKFGPLVRWVKVQWEAFKACQYKE